MAYSFLVIVESPAKAKTIQKYLGPHFTVMSSYGHIQDLLPKSGAVDPDQHFAMHYELIEKNKKHVQAIIRALKQADTLYLATDPDREGEAIAYHIYSIAKKRKVLAKKKVYRIVFHEITQSSIQTALAHPHDINMHLVNAQQARRALDYLVGFNLSPLLWKKIRYGLSAGRVQSPALRMIVEKEEEIERFVKKEYWDLEATVHTQQKSFTTKLIIFNQKKLKQFSIANQEQATAMQTTLLAEAEGTLCVAKIDQRQRKRHPAPPFVTATLQQEAAHRLGFTAKYTMRIAQQLYEGIELASESTGLITYMRTDSVQLAQEAISNIRAFIKERYGKENMPSTANIYKTKAKNAQEAHEAIRPTTITHTPETIKSFLTEPQYKLYHLIWQRTIASQMISAIIDTVAIHFAIHNQHTFCTTGSTIRHSGYMRVYQESLDEPSAAEQWSVHWLPILTIGEHVSLKKIVPHQHFTDPPARYSEATLIKTLEEYGIGRPSTYATIVSTLQTRDYVALQKKRFYPTDIGRVVNQFLTKYFTHYVDYNFTATLEDELDDISRGEKEWIPLLTTFWLPFKQQVNEVVSSVKRQEVTQEQLDEQCPNCQKQLSIRLGKRGRFIGCTGYPDCSYTRPLSTDHTEQEVSECIENKLCPTCNSLLKIKHGPYGKFIGCSNYPTCKYIESLNKPTDTRIPCPECQNGTILRRTSRRGKTFFSCERYPNCKYALWNEPIAKSCPMCSWPILTIKYTKRYGTELVCPRSTCSYKQSIENPS